MDPAARRLKLDPHGSRAVNMLSHGGERPKIQSMLPLKFFGEEKNPAISSTMPLKGAIKTSVNTNPIQAGRYGGLSVGVEPINLCAPDRRARTQINRTPKMIIETSNAKTQGAHKILSSNFSARRLKSRYYSSNRCICVPFCPVNETRLGTGGHAKKLISLVLLRGRRNQKPNFNDFLLKTTHSDIVPYGGEPKSGFAQLNKKEKQSD